MISTVLFDLDGVLSDTECLHRQAYQEVLRQHGLDLSDEEYLDWWTRRGLGIADLLRQRQSSLEPTVLRRLKAARYVHLVQTTCRAMPGAMDLLDRLRGRKRLALASSALADAVEAVLSKLGIRDRFECIVTGSDVRRVKPAPDIFLRAAELMGVAPTQCVVIEDAEKGVVAAHAAGMRCIAVPNDVTADHDFAKADLVLASLDQVKLEAIDSLAGR